MPSGNGVPLGLSWVPPITMSMRPWGSYKRIHPNRASATNETPSALIRELDMGCTVASNRTVSSEAPGIVVFQARSLGRGRAVHH